MKIDRRSTLRLSGAVALFASAVALSIPLQAFGPSPALAQSASKLMEPQPLPDMVLGDAAAPVTIVEYASMTCPHCADFHNKTLPALKEKYIDTGKVKLILREFPFDPRAAAAFMLARCAPQDQYFPMVGVLFQQQQVWVAAKDAKEPLLQIAKLAGFTQDKFEACLKNQELLDKIRAGFDKAAKEYGVESTPTFFINGEKTTGTMSLEAMSKLIDKYL